MVEIGAESGAWRAGALATDGAGRVTAGAAMGALATGALAIGALTTGVVSEVTDVPGHCRP